MYSFFVSYIRDENGAVPDLLESFIKDLEFKLRKPGTEAEDDPPIAFIDRKELKLGVDWDKQLSLRLDDSSSLLCIITQEYLKSEFCTKERQYFLQRIGRSRIPAILPILWNFKGWDLKYLPEELRKVQFDQGSLPKAYQEDGLEMLARYRPNGSEYESVVMGVAEWVRRVASQPLPRLNWDKPLSEFIYKGGSRTEFNVSAIVVSALQPQLSSLSAVRLQAYPEKNATEWQPYFPPDERELAIWTQRIATIENTLVMEWIVDPEQDLSKVVEQAFKEHRGVICFLDPLTMALRVYGEWVRRLSHVNADSAQCVALVPVWRTEDLESNSVFEPIMSKLNDVLAPWVFNGGYTYEEMTIQNAVGFEEEIPKVFAKLRLRTIFGTSEPPRRIADCKGPSSPAEVTGPSGEGASESRKPVLQFNGEVKRSTPFSEGMSLTLPLLNSKRVSS